MLAGEAEDVSLGGQRGQQRSARRAEVHVGLEGGEGRHPDDGTFSFKLLFLVESLLLLPDGLLEALLEQRQLRDQVSDGVHQRLLLEINVSVHLNCQPFK